MDLCDIKNFGLNVMQRHFFSSLKQIISLNVFLQCSVVANELLYLCREKQKSFFIVNNSYGFFKCKGLPVILGFFFSSTVF